MSGPPDCTVVILNWNGRDHLATYLPSVVANSPHARIVVADNGSTDDSQSVVDAHPPCEWLALEENYGFADGYNRALAGLAGEILVLLNSDVRVTPGWLDAPLARLAGDSRVAAVQPKVRADRAPTYFEYAGAAGGYLDRLGYPYCRGRVFATVEEDRGQYDTAREVDWATGACCFVRAGAWRAVGGFDGDFFAHMEEIDLCWRLRRAGYTCWVEPSSVVYHLGGGTLAYQSPRKTYLNFRNSLATLAKNLPGARLVPVLFMRLVLDGVAGLKFLLAGEPAQVGAILRAHGRFYAWLPGLLRGRAAFAKTLHTNSERRSGSQDRASAGRRPWSVVWAYYVRGRQRFDRLHPE